MDTSNVPQSWVNGVFAAFVALCWWVYRKLDRKVEKISADYVTREDLAAAMDRHNIIVQTMHVDNARNFDNLRTELQGVNSKLFDLSGRLQK